MAASGTMTAARQVELLLKGVHEACGVDLREYASVERRVERFRTEVGEPSLASLLERIRADKSCLERLLVALFVRVTAMFRDPRFYRTIRENVVPFLRTHPFVRIWHAGCSTGEEVYSLAILLREAGLY